jgi:hypothetical protein
MTIGSGWRVGIIAAYGLLAAVWAYAEQRQSDLPAAAYELTHNTFALLAFVLLAVLTGFAVGRLWALLSLLGPLLTLGFMQAAGYVSPWHDGAEPLTSLPSIVQLTWLAMLLLAGVGLSRMVRGSGSATPDREGGNADADQHQTADQDQSPGA